MTTVTTTETTTTEQTHTRQNHARWFIRRDGPQTHLYASAVARCIAPAHALTHSFMLLLLSFCKLYLAPSRRHATCTQVCATAQVARPKLMVPSSNHSGRQAAAVAFISRRRRRCPCFGRGAIGVLKTTSESNDVMIYATFALRYWIGAGWGASSRGEPG